jgi:hypothetical protein
LQLLVLGEPCFAGSGIQRKYESGEAFTVAGRTTPLPLGFSVSADSKGVRVRIACNCVF